MIHLDTNILIDIVTAHSPQVAMVRGWLSEGKTLTTSAVAWSEFLNGPHSHGQKDAVRAVLAGGIRPFDEEQAELASRLFHVTGRRRGSHADCMIAAAALARREVVATRNLKDFQRFVPHGLMLEAIPTVD
ncbi:MAG: type II toxin-antitoxin system VapC family toxin [Verrucomicrobiae bacterium]|nr:type II toxin-antitoxin system VapC family toxin [Verrucomicrobiae bacterium]MCP5543375.1 type II toxin-antitoxin system VapC family toxin [Akkermansiaceae bacterium]MCP5548568.1 type II toxin-antitoxin system VapC family toxin [Akkermansiaceae bacterium]